MDTPSTFSASAVKIDQSNVMRVISWGLSLYWLTLGVSVTAVIVAGGDKTIGLGLGIMAIIAASFCAGGAMLLLASDAVTALRAKWKVSRVSASAWTGWLILPLPPILFVAWMFAARIFEG